MKMGKTYKAPEKLKAKPGEKEKAMAKLIAGDTGKTVAKNKI